MKKMMLLLMAVLTFGLALVSCSDTDVDLSIPDTPEVEKADYTVIFWGMSGGNDLDASTDLATLAYNYQQGLIGKKVNIAGLMKTALSKAFPGSVDASYDKTMYFDSENIGTQMISKDEVDVEKLINLTTDEEKISKIKSNYKETFDALGGKVYGDTIYPLNNVDSLANFIKATAKKFPARHYVLMLFGHGNGFSIETDTPVSSRACVFDDYTDGLLSADAVVSAVRKSDVKMQTLFTQCCLMATLENIAAYSQVFDYGVLSAETTYGYYFPEYLVKLTQAGDDETKLQEKSRELIDYYVDRIEKLDAIENVQSYTSHGFYNLRKADQLLSATREAADWFTANYTDNKIALEKALNSSIVNCEFEGEQKYVDSVRQVRQYIQDVLNQKITFDSREKWVDYAVTVVKQMKTFVDYYAFSMSDVMRNAIQADLPQVKTAALEVIYDKYMTALKDMAYIRTTQKPSSADADYEYIYASPTINILSMNPDYFIPLPKYEEIDELAEQMYQAIRDKDWDKYDSAAHKMLDGTLYAEGRDLTTAKSIYTSSVFDQKVKWSRFLELLEFSPSMGICPDRWQVNQNMKS